MFIHFFRLAFFLTEFTDMYKLQNTKKTIYKSQIRSIAQISDWFNNLLSVFLKKKPVGVKQFSIFMGSIKVRGLYINISKITSPTASPFFKKHFLAGWLI